jgi:MGT family glycosyltransferase
VVVFSTEALVGRDLSWPAHYRFVGPSIEARADETPFPWHELGKRPRVFVSLGTIGSDSAGNARFFAATVDALRDFDGQVILVAPNGMVTQPPASFIVRERVPQLALLREVDAVVTHGGHNTVCEALAHGLPMVVAPIRHDQPTVAAQVVRAGAAVRVRYGRISANVLRDAVERALHDPELRAAAMRVGESFRNAGGAQAAAQALEQLA